MVEYKFTEKISPAAKKWRAQSALALHQQVEIQIHHPQPGRARSRLSKRRFDA